MANRGPGVLSWSTRSERGRRAARVLGVLLSLQLAGLGAPAAAEKPAAQPPAAPAEWANAYQVGYSDAATCTSAAILHGCPQPVSPAPELDAKYRACVAQYQAGYRAGESAPGRLKKMEQAKALGASDAAGCIRARNAPGLDCRAEWERLYRAAYGLPGEACRGKWKNATEPGPGYAPEVPLGAVAAPPAPQASASIEPPQPPVAEADEAEEAEESGSKGSSGGEGMSLLPLIAGGAAAAVGAVYLGSVLGAASKPKSCSTWGQSNCPSVPSAATMGSDNLCHCCVPICSGGSCSCMACGSGCGGSLEMCIGSTCYFRVGGSP